MVGKKTGRNGNKALDFIYSLEKSSEKIESFFKGFIYFLALRHVKDRDHLDIEFKKWDKDFDYFTNALRKKNLAKPV